MSAEHTYGSEITVEIERLRDEFQETQDLYREVCVLLFFRYGITPTANKLYQLVRKGSMSAPTEALRNFWIDLREKSRVRIEHPDLPDSLRSAAGELVSTLWSHAQHAAFENLSALNEKAAEAIRIAQDAKVEADAEAHRLQLLVDETKRQFSDAQTHNRELERRLAVEYASQDALRAQLQKAERQIQSLENAVNETRREFAVELEKQRQALERSEERLQGAEKRALLEIDRERMASQRLQKKVEQLRQAAQETTDAHQAATNELRRQYEKLLQKVGYAEGLVDAQREENRETVTQLEALRSRAKELEAQLVLSEREVALRDEHIEELSRKKAELESSLAKPKIKPGHRNSKQIVRNTADSQ